LFENEKSFQGNDDSSSTKRTLNFLELMHMFNENLAKLGK